MINIEGLIEHLQNNFRDRLKLLATIEELRKHHLVRDNAEFYLDDNGELHGRIRKGNYLFEAERLQVEGRLSKIHALMKNYNQTYKKLRKIIVTELNTDRALEFLKECAEESIKLYDEINDLVVAKLKQHKLISEGFQGKLDINILKNTPNSQKMTLMILQQYIDYEIKFYKQFEKEMNNLKTK